MKRLFQQRFKRYGPDDFDDPRARTAIAVRVVYRRQARPELGAVKAFHCAGDVAPVRLAVDHTCGLQATTLAIANIDRSHPEGRRFEQATR